MERRERQGAIRKPWPQFRSQPRALTPGVIFSVYLKGRANVFADIFDVPGVKERSKARMTLGLLTSRTLARS